MMRPTLWIELQAAHWPLVIDRQHPLAAGLVGAWPFLPAGGSSLYDLSGLGQHGTLNNFTLPDAWTTAERWPALDFDGADDDVDLPNVIDPNAGPFSCSVWVWADLWQGSGGQVVLQQLGATGRNWLTAKNQAAGDRRMQSFIGGAATLGATNINGRTNQWMHWGLTVSGGGAASTVRLYLDGLEDGSSSQDPEASTGNHRIGKHKTPDTTNEEWDGKLALVFFWNRELAAAEMYRLFAAPWSIFRARLSLLHQISTAVATAVEALLAAPWESLAGVSQTGVPPWEALALVQQTGVPPWEALALAQQTGAPPWEALALAQQTGATPWEALAGVSQTGVPPWESLAGVSQTGVPPWEALALVQQTGVPPWEALALVQQTGVPPWEALALVQQTGVPPWEASVITIGRGRLGFGLGLGPTFTFEFGLGPALAAALGLAPVLTGEEEQ